VIPAAGQSLRMGNRNKLLLPWADSTVVEQVLSAWSNSQVDRVVLVSRPGDSPVQNLVRKFPGVELLIPEETPADMKRSVQFGLQHFNLTGDAPNHQDRWLIAPADLPTMTSTLIDRVIASSRDTSAIVIPKFAERRGHPVSFPWSLSNLVSQLGDDEGIDRLLDGNPVKWLLLDASQYPADIDTPDDYHRLRQTRDTGQTP
jgi:molybdenum cofactor cytidylyltransferase